MLIMLLLNILLVCFIIFSATHLTTLARIINENNTKMEVEEMFEQIEENHNRLKEVFENVILKEEPESENACVCVPYYLCNVTTGEINRDGRLLLESRSFGTNPCKDKQDICCERYDLVDLSSKMSITQSYQCGYGSEFTQQPRNDDPTQSKFGEFPWTAVISKQGGMYECVGSLIHPQVILTAAHCVNLTENYKARMGEWNVMHRNEPSSHQNQVISKIIKHPQFFLENLHYDVALLITEEPFEFDVNVNTLCLTSASPATLSTNADQCVATGWGKNRIDGHYSSIMNKIPMSLTSQDLCQKIYRTTRLGKWYDLHHSFVCAFGLDGFDACKGNGGGPLVCPISEYPGRFQQVGITSWGIECATGLPTVFTNIAHVKEWIDSEFEDLGFSKEYYTYVESDKTNNI